MKQANFIFSGYNKKDELIESFIIEDRTEHEANNEAMHYVEAHQSINDWSLTPTPVKETEQPEQPYYKGKGEHSVNQLEAICSQYKEYVSFLNSRGNDTTPTSKEGLEDINTDLLNACQMVLDDWHDDDANFEREEPKYLEKIRLAINKAKAILTRINKD